MSKISQSSDSACPASSASSVGSPKRVKTRSAGANDVKRGRSGVPLTWKEVQQLKRTIPVEGYEIGDVELVRARLRKALKGEDERGRKQHWSYDQNRHMALMKFLRKYEGMRDDQPR